MISSRGFPGSSAGKESACNAGDPGLIPGLGRSAGEGMGSLSAQSCLTVCNPRHCSLPGSTVHGILQARILEWVAILFSRDPPNPGIEPRSPTLQGDSVSAEPQGKPIVSVGRQF